MASNWAVIYLFIFCIVGSCSSELVIPAIDTIQEWARDIQTNLVQYLNDNMKPAELTNIYKQAANDGHLKEVYVDGNELVAKVATNWVSLLEKKKTAVKKIVEFLENSSLTTEYSAEPEVDFLNAKEDIEGMLLDTFGGKAVTYNQSAVQIPTDIYVEDPIILNAIKVTDGIDKIFINNRENDSELLWQYVGSSTGFYRSYPGKGWDLPEGKLRMDQYDVRRRSWYIGAANSPKDVLILVDISGSTSGITSNLIKVSVCEAIDTLGDDDFVNVALFNDNTTFLDAKLTTFVQANLRNKQHLKKEIKEYMDQKNATEKMANYTRALEFAFTELDKLMKEAVRSDSGIGAKCNSVILMFTDGGPDKATEIIKKYNSDNRTRIFVYNVGPNAMVSSDGVKNMACMTNGYFSSIPSIGAVRLTTLDYIPVLSRPLVLAGNRTYQWSNIYLDALGLGMMTTLTLPAFNKSITYDENGDEIPNQQLLGVVGTDVTIKGMEELVPKRRPHFNSSYRCIGPEGYAFGINSNGYILIHPRLKGQLGYLSDPPNVDLLEVEVIPKGSDDLARLRKAMIDEKTSNVTFPSLIMSQGERYVHNISMTYSFTNINATSFSMAIVQPKFDLYEFQVNKTILDGLIKFFAEEVTKGDEDEEIVSSDDDITSLQVEIENEDYDILTDDISSLQIKIERGVEGNVALTDDFSSLVPYTSLASTGETMGTALFPNWELCIGLTSSSTIRDVLEHLRAEYVTMANCIELGDEPKFVSCDDMIVPCLWFDMRSVQDYAKDNKVARLFDDGTGPDYLMIATKCGYTHIYPNWTQELSNSSEDLRDPWEQNYYQRSLYKEGFVFAVPYKPDNYRDDSGDSFLVTISSSIRVRQVIPAVMSVYLRYEQFNGIWLSQSNYCTDKRIICYLLDDGGFLISSNLDSTTNVGRFFGMFEGNIMRALTSSGIYDKEELYDFQASCESEEPTLSFGLKSFYVPTIAEFINFNWFVTTASWSFVKQIFYQIMTGDFSIFTVFGQEVTTAAMEEEEEEIEKPPGNESCIKKQRLWHYGNLQAAEGNVTNCRRYRYWKAARLDSLDDGESTNLLLVVVDAPDNSTYCPSKALSQEPEKDSGPKPEDEAKNPRYRRRPKNCFYTNPAEQHICSGGIIVGPLFWLLVAVQTLLVFHRWV